MTVTTTDPFLDTFSDAFGVVPPDDGGGDDGGGGDGEPPFVPPRDTIDVPTVSVWSHRAGVVWEKIGQVGKYSTLTFTPTYQDAGTWTITLPWDNAAILLPNHLVTIDWRLVRSTWLIEEWHPARTEDAGSPVLTVSGGGAKAMLGRCLCWPDATNTLDAQPDYVDTKAAPFKGAAETILRQLIIDNFGTRYGASFRTEPSANRGTTVKVRPKFDNLFELVQSNAKDGGIGFDFGLEDTDATHADLWLRFNKPTDKAKSVRLTSRLGTIAAWEQVDTAPVATHAMVAYGPTANDAQTSVVGHVTASADIITVASAKSFPDPSGDNPPFRIVIGDETLRVRGFPVTSLNGAVTASANTIEVSATTAFNFPRIGGSGPDSFPITVGDETMRVMATDGTEWSVRRGVGEGKATAHDNNTRVQALRTWFVDRGVGSTVPEPHDEGDAVRATRRYKEITTPTSLAAADAWGGVREVYVAGPDTADPDEIAASGRASLSDGAETRALNVTAAEAVGMRAFTHYNVSDLVTMEVETGAVATENVTSIEVTVDDSGISVKPTIGNPGVINSTLRMGQLFQALARRVRRIEKD